MTLFNTFAPDPQALQAAHAGVVLIDRSDWGQLWLSGSGGLEFLHNQSTQDLKSLQPGQGADTVFVNATAHILDLTTAYVSEDGIRLLTSPQRRQALSHTLGQFIRFVKGCQLSDQTESRAMFSLIGSECRHLWEQLGVEISHTTLHQHQRIRLDDHPVEIAVGSGLSESGFTLFCERTAAEQVWTRLVGAGAVPASSSVWESLRIRHGRPEADHELTADYNPLEAGLWQAISLTKGCYIGQEVLAKQVTYQRIRQKLWGIRLPELVPEGSVVTLDSDKIGILTSITQTDQGAVGLAYLRTKVDPEGQNIKVAGLMGEVVQCPFLSFPPSRSA